MLEEYLEHIQKLDSMLAVLFEITLILILIGFGFLVIKFVRIATSEKMIFHFVTKLGENQLTKPIYGCEYCMASIWGLIVYSGCTIGLGWMDFNYLHLFIYLPSLSGFMKYFDEKRERVVLNLYEEKEEQVKPKLNGYATDNLSPYDN